MSTNINYKLISEEINQILSGLYGIYISDGRPTKKGGLRKNFVEVKYNIPTEELLSDENITKYAKEHNMTNSKMIIKYILKDYVAPFAKDEMDHLIDTIRNLG